MAEGVRVGEGYIEIKPNLDEAALARDQAVVQRAMGQSYGQIARDFRAQFQRATAERLAFDKVANNQVMQAAVRLEQQKTKALQQAERERARIVADGARARASVEATIEKAARSHEADLRRRAFREQQNETSRVLKDFEAQRLASSAANDRLGATISGRIFRDAENEKTKVAAAASRARANREERDQKDLARRIRALQTLTPNVVLPVALGAVATPALLGLAQNLAPAIAAASAALPALISGVVVGAGVMALAFSGVGNAIQKALDPTASPEAFQKALKRLSPAAQEFAVAIKGAQGPLLGFRNGIQDAFFRGLGPAHGFVVQLAAALRVLQPTLSGVAGEMGKLARGLFNTATTGAGLEFIKQIADGVRQFIAAIQPGLRAVELGFLSISAKGAAFGRQFGQVIGGLLTQFGTFLSKVDVAGLFRAATPVLIAFVNILKDAGGIIAQIARIAGETNFLGMLDALLRTVNVWLHSKAGIDAMRALFSALNAIGSAAAQAIGILLDAIGQALIAISPYIKPVLDVLVGLLRMLLPLVQPLAVIAGLLLKNLANVLGALAVVLKPVVDLFSALLAAVGPVLAAYVKAAGDTLRTMTPVFKALGDVFRDAAPILVRIVNEFFKAIQPYIPQLMNAFKQLVPPLTQVMNLLGKAYLDALLSIVPYIPELARATGQFAVAVAQLLVQVVPLITHIFGLQLRTKTLIPLMWGLIGVMYAATYIVKAISGIIFILKEVFHALGVAGLWLWHNALEPAFHAIGAVISGFWNVVAKPVFAAVWFAFRVWRAVTLAFYDEVWKPIFRAIGAAAHWVWDTALKPVFDSIKSGWSLVARTFKDVWDWMYKHVFKPVMSFVKGDLQGAFKAAVSGISNIWGGLKSIFEAPIKFFVETVYDGGIAKIWNKIAGVVGHGFPTLPILHIGDGGGGKPTTARSGDNQYHHAADGLLMIGGRGGPRQDNQLVAVSRGESIIDAETTAAYAPLLAAISGSRFGSNTGPRYADGGIVGGAASLLGPAALDIASVFTKPVKALVNQIPGGGAYAGLLKGAGNFLTDQAAPTLVRGAANAAGGLFKGLGKKAAGLLKNLWAHVSGGGGNVGAWIAQAAKYTSIPPDWVAGIRTIIARESGGNPNAINLTDVNAQRGDPSIGLMQVIGSTFRAYRDARLPNNQRDPVANIVAGVNYIRSRYGSIHNVQQADPSRPPKGYASGGILGPGQLGFNETTRPEYILNGAQFAQLANGGNGLNIDRLTVNLGNREFEGYVDSRIDESNRELSLTLVGR